MQGTHFKEHAKGGSIRRGVVNPDLQEERDKCTFDQKEVQDFLQIPDTNEYYGPMIEDIKKHPELQAQPQFLEMTREEQMKWIWQLKKNQMKINPERYFYQIESSLHMPQLMTPGIDNTALHYGMFQTAI